MNTIRIKSSHPAYEKLSTLLFDLSLAINRWPFSIYCSMPDYELQLTIEEIKSEIEKEHTNILSSSINFLN